MTSNPEMSPALETQNINFIYYFTLLYKFAAPNIMLQKHSLHSKRYYYERRGISILKRRFKKVK